MNNTKKAQLDMARRMVAGRLDVDEIVEMTELPLEEVQKLKDEFESLMHSELQNTNLDMSGMIFDNNVTDEEMDDFNMMLDAYEQLKKD